MRSPARGWRSANSASILLNTGIRLRANSILRRPSGARLLSCSIDVIALSSWLGSLPPA